MHLITTTEELARFVTKASTSKFVTVDTEFIRETTFWPELCLVQMAISDDTALVDPLANGIDLTPLWQLMANEAVEKVFHAARQDIEIVYKMGNLIPHPVFDTQVAAMVCGFGDSVSYDQLVRRITGAHIDKSSRFTDWRRRPLSEKQLDYALADVTHLIDVYQHLNTRLEESGRIHWVAEEMEILTSPGTYDIHPDDAWRRLKMRVRRPVELAIMQSVAAWRERLARERDVPRNRVLRDDAIYEVAQQAPRDVQALARLRAIPKGWERSAYADGLLEAVNFALGLSADDLPMVPKRKHSPEGTSASAELLKVMLKLVAEDLGVAAKILATSDDIEKIAAEGENADVAALSGWRMEVFGSKALQMLRGEIGVRLDNRRIVTYPI